MLETILITTFAGVGAFLVTYFVTARLFKRPQLASRVAFVLAVAALAVGFANSDLGTVPAPVTATIPPAVAAAAASPPRANPSISKCKWGRITSSAAVGAVDLARTNESSIDDGASIDRGVPLYIQGWAVSKDRVRLAKSLCLIVDGRPSTSVVDYGSSRPDVAAVYHVDSLSHSGYSLAVSLKSFTRGLHSFGLAVESADGSHDLIAKQIHLIVR